MKQRVNVTSSRHNSPGTAPDKKGMQIYIEPLQAWVKACPDCHPKENPVREVLLDLHKKFGILEDHVTDKKSLFLVATDAADIWRTIGGHLLGRPSG